MKKILKWVAIVFVAMIVIGVIFGDEETENTAKAPEYKVLKDEVAKKSSDIDQVVAIEKVESVDEDPGLTISQKNAVKSAKNYLSFQGFSRKGLIEQLSSSAGDGYDVEDATVAVDSLDVNWNDQAVKSAKNYLSFQGFSRKGLIEQLSSSAGDGYDVEDATVAVDSLDINWNDQAVKSAKNYLSFQGFSCKGLIEQLSSSAGDGFTVEQATYGAQQVGICE